MYMKTSITGVYAAGHMFSPRFSQRSVPYIHHLLSKQQQCNNVLLRLMMRLTTCKTCCDFEEYLMLLCSKEKNNNILILQLKVDMLDVIPDERYIRLCRG